MWGKVGVAQVKDEHVSIANCRASPWSGIAYGTVRSTPPSSVARAGQSAVAGFAPAVTALGQPAVLPWNPRAGPNFLALLRLEAVGLATDRALAI